MNLNLNWSRIAVCLGIYGIGASATYLLLVSSDNMPTSNGHPLPFILFVGPAINLLRGPSNNRTSVATQILGVSGIVLISLLPFVASWCWPEKIVTKTDGILGCCAACTLVFALDWVFDYFGSKLSRTKTA